MSKILISIKILLFKNKAIFTFLIRMQSTVISCTAKNARTHK